MRGLHLDNGALSFRRNLPEPDVPNGWSLVRVALAAICNTDLELRKGYMDFSGVPGHEFVGVVERSGNAALVGKRVVGEINAACGACDTCKAGRPRHCPHRTVLGIAGLNGAFAEHLALPDANLHPLPDGLSDETAVFVEPAAAACEILEQVSIGPADEVLVVGAGKLGSLVCQVLRTTGCGLTVLVRSKASADRLTALAVPSVRKAGLKDRRFDVVVECSGNEDGFALALERVRPKGTIVLKSTYAGDVSLFAAKLVVDEITVVGSRCGPFRPAIAMLASGVVRVGGLVDSRYPLDRGIAAFRRASARGSGKVLVEVNSVRAGASDRATGEKP